MAQILVRTLEQFQALAPGYRKTFTQHVSIQTDIHIVSPEHNIQSSALSVSRKDTTVVVYVADTLCHHWVLKPYGIYYEDVAKKIDEVTCPLCLTEFNNI